MKSKWLKNIKRLGLFVVGLFVIAVALVWFSGETEIGDIFIENGEGIFQHEDVAITMNATNNTSVGQVKVVEHNNKKTANLLEAAYTSPNSYALVGAPELFEGTLKVEFPLDEKLKAYPREELKRRLYIVTEEPAYTKDGEMTMNQNLHLVQIDEENQTLTATITYKDVDLLSNYSPPIQRGFSLFKRAWADNNEGENNMTISVDVRYFPKLKKLKSKYFTMHYIKGDKDTIRLKKLMSGMDEFVPKIYDVGLNINELKLPMDVYLKDLPTGPQADKLGELSADWFNRKGGDLSLNKNILLDKDLSDEAFEEMRVTAGHEFFHLVQQNYWRRQHSIYAAGDFDWIDESTAVAFESFIAKKSDYLPSPMNDYCNYSLNGLLHANNFIASGKLQNYGYGMSYIINYLTKVHPNRKRIIGDIYKTFTQSEANTPDIALNKIINRLRGSDQFWLDFLNTEMINQEKINPLTAIVKSKNRILGVAKGSEETTYIAYSKWGTVEKPQLIKELGKNKVVLEAELPNLSAEIIKVQLKINDEKTKKLLKTLGRKYKVTVSGGERTGVMLFHTPQGGKNKIYKSTSFTDNLLKSGNSTELTELAGNYFVLVNYDDDVMNPQKRKVTVTITFEAGESFEDIAPPPSMNIVDEKALKELNKWLDFCNKQKQAQQQSNQYLMDYYKNKAKEYETAIALLKKDGTNVYKELDISVKPENPVTLMKQMERSIKKIEKIQDYAFNVKINIDDALSNPTAEVAADKDMYQLTMELFDYRQVAYYELLSYLKAGEVAQNIDNTTIEPNEDDVPKPKKLDNDPSFYLGTWNYYDEYGEKQGTITIGKKSMSMNINHIGIDIKVNNLPIEVKVSDSSNGLAATISTSKTNYKPYRDGVYAYYCEGNSSVCTYGTVRIYQNYSDYNGLEYSFYKKETTYTSFKQSGGKGLLKR